MAQKITGLRVVLASPSDVKRKREAFTKIIDQVNTDTARPAGFHLDLWRWETDSRPGFNPMGPQGLIDKVLRIDHCDLFVGIWNRIGSPTKFGKTGTEHEFETAYKAWKRKRTPDIMFYFNEKPSNLTSDADLAQRGKVLGFKRTFPEEGLYWPYKGYAEFLKYANEHLRKFIHEYVARQNGGAAKKRLASAPRGKAKPDSGPVDVFTLKVGRAGAVTLPAALLKLLGIRVGDQLELRAVNNRIVSGTGVLKDQPFDPATVTQLLERLSSSAISLTAAELRATFGKGKRNG
jgi:bifunctional DNA-binding transcriptional regulator/antitoxin component of YhaV-PrlF toxin-antitoxin module